MSEKRFLTIERVRQLQETIGFLDTYTLPSNEEHHIGPNINTIEVKRTNLLHELGRINKRRKQIIEELCKQKKL